VPSLKIDTLFGYTNPNIFIRGVGTNDFNDNANAAVSIYLDEANIGAPGAQLFQAFDLERVEVLRGPQGTLYGRNTTGGAINFITERPSDDLNGFVRATAGSYSQAEVEAAVTLPIVQDRLSARPLGGGAATGRLARQQLHRCRD
jgi:iron complex outermembrane receptor protein